MFRRVSQKIASFMKARLAYAAVCVLVCAGSADARRISTAKINELAAALLRQPTHRPSGADASSTSGKQSNSQTAAWPSSFPWVYHRRPGEREKNTVSINIMPTTSEPSPKYIPKKKPECWGSILHMAEDQGCGIAIDGWPDSDLTENLHCGMQRVPLISTRFPESSGYFYFAGNGYSQPALRSCVVRCVNLNQCQLLQAGSKKVMCMGFPPKSNKGSCGHLIGVHHPIFILPYHLNAVTAFGLSGIEDPDREWRKFLNFPGGITMTTPMFHGCRFDIVELKNWNYSHEYFAVHVEVKAIEHWDAWLGDHGGRKILSKSFGQSMFDDYDLEMLAFGHHIGPHKWKWTFHFLNKPNVIAHRTIEIHLKTSVTTLLSEWTLNGWEFLTSFFDDARSSEQDTIADAMLERTG